MLMAVQGFYRNGKIELPSLPGNVCDDTPVIVTFLQPDLIDLRERGIDESQAANLRTRLGQFLEDWDNPDMDVYNDYDANKSILQSR